MRLRIRRVVTTAVLLQLVVGFVSVGVENGVISGPGVWTGCRHDRPAGRLNSIRPACSIRRPTRKGQAGYIRLDVMPFCIRCML